MVYAKSHATRGQRALPQGYSLSVFRQLESGGPAPKGESVFTRIVGAPDGAQVRAGILAKCQEGQHDAIAKGLLTAASLALLRQILPMTDHDRQLPHVGQVNYGEAVGVGPLNWNGRQASPLQLRR